MQSPTTYKRQTYCDNKSPNDPNMVNVDLGSNNPEHDHNAVRSPLLTQTKEAPLADVADATAYVWKTSLWRRFPWFGLIGLTTAIVCSFTSFMVLYFSDKRPATKWISTHGKLAPNVIISILNNLGNISIAVAFGEGTAIHWWRRAQSVSTMQQLHNSWSFSVETFGILRRLGGLNIVAFISLVAKVASIDGILYQQATSSYVDTYTSLLQEDIIAFGGQTFPRTGTFGPSTAEDGHMSDKFEITTLDWDRIGSKADKTPKVYHCNGLICKFHIISAGFAMDCTNSSVDVDYGAKRPVTLTERDVFEHTKDIQKRKSTTESQQTKTTTESKKPKSTTSSKASKATAEPEKPKNITKLQSVIADADFVPLFSTNFTRVYLGGLNFSALQMDILYTQFSGGAAVKDGSCPSRLITKSCILRPALLNYTVVYTNVSSLPLSNMKYADGSPKKKTVPTVSQKSGTRLYSDCNDNTVGNDADCSRYDPNRKQIDGVKFIEYLNFTDKFKAGDTSRMEGFYLAFKARLESQSRLRYKNKTFFYDVTGFQSVLSRNKATNTPAGYCNFTFDDPQNYLMTRINALTIMTMQNHKLFFHVNDNGIGRNYSSTFRESTLAQVQNQTVRATVLYNDIFFSSDKTFMYAAFSATLAVVLCMLPLFWGFWELPRRVTLSPIEIANAFQGPTFSDIHGDSIREVLKQIGKAKVVYAPIRSDARKHQFKFV